MHPCTFHAALARLDTVSQNWTEVDISEVLLRASTVFTQERRFDLNCGDCIDIVDQLWLESIK
jgi:hypothetical protein